MSDSYEKIFSNISVKQNIISELEDYLFQSGYGSFEELSNEIVDSAEYEIFEDDLENINVESPFVNKFIVEYYVDVNVHLSRDLSDKYDTDDRFENFYIGSLFIKYKVKISFDSLPKLEDLNNGTQLTNVNILSTEILNHEFTSRFEE